MSAQALEFSDYAEFLQDLGKRSDQQFLMGGQAVNFWAEFFDRREASDGLGALRPFTSKDCDVWVSGSLWSVLKAAEAGRLTCGESPADGQLGVLKLNDDPPRLVDFLSYVYGFNVKEQAKVLARAPIFEGVRVIDPLSLYRSKCHCFLNLDQTDRQDERHVRMLALILPEYVSLLADRVESGEVDARKLIKEIKLLEKIAASGACRRAMEKLGMGEEPLVPWARLETCGSEVLAGFAAKRGIS